MIVRFDGGAPPDESEWLDVLCDALGEAASSAWVRFYREPGGWRFDLECRNELGSYDPSGKVAGIRAWGSRPSFASADESVALRVYTLLVESGKPLDPGWRPFAPSPPAAVVRTPALVVAPAAPPVAEAVPVPLAEAPPPAAIVRTQELEVPPAVPPVAEAAPVPLVEAPPPALEGNLPAGGGRRRRRRRRNRSLTPPELVGEPKTESVEGTLPAPLLEWDRPSEPEPPPEPEPPAEPQSPPARRPGWRGLRPAIVYLPAVLLVAFAVWLARDRLQSRPAPPPVPTPSATVSDEALTAQKRLTEPEAVVAQPKQDRRPPTQRVEKRADEILAPTTAPRRPTPTTPPTPTPVTAPAAAATNVPLPTEPPVSTNADVTPALVPAAAAEPPPVQPGAMVDVNDPGLTRPVPVTQTQPRYPPLALQRRLSGTVWLRALVDETGAVVEVSLVRASPRRLDFEGAAMTWLRERVYRPATTQGVPVRVWLPVVVEFRPPAR